MSDPCYLCWTLPCKGCLCQAVQEPSCLWTLEGNYKRTSMHALTHCGISQISRHVFVTAVQVFRLYCPVLLRLPALVQVTRVA